MYRNERDHLRLTPRAGPKGTPLTRRSTSPGCPGALALGAPRSSMRPATRKLVSYARAGGSQGKL
jgi:hypothetical protein